MHYKHGSTFADPAYWQNSPLTSKERARVAKALDMIPDGVRSVLDVGCGSGKVTSRLRQHYDVLAVDLNDAALRATGGEGVRASASRLPFRDRSFDLVCSTEVLEHLSPKDYIAAVSELARVSRRYVLLSVPASENLLNDSINCPNCGHLYHVWGHQRSFSPEAIKDLSPNLRLLAMSNCGRITRRPVITQWVRRRVAGQKPVNPYECCPSCGMRTTDRFRRNLITYICTAIDTAISIIPRPRWFVCLYERNQETR